MTDTSFRPKAKYRFKQAFGAIPAAEISNVKNEVADRLGISLAQLNRIIRGESDPSGTQLFLIAESLNTTVNDLYAPPECLSN